MNRLTNTGFTREMRWMVVAMIAIAALSPRASAQLSLSSGSLTMSITSALPGSEPQAVVSSTTSLNYYRQNTVITKITVQTSCPGQKFGLKVLAVSPSIGTAAPEVVLNGNSSTATDLITSIPRNLPSRLQTATLQYTATSTFAQGNSTELGNDVHTVTFTQVAQ